MAAHYEGEQFRERFGPWAVVAGGSDGIGEAFARECARRGLNVALVARRREPLEHVAAAIRAGEAAPPEIPAACAALKSRERTAIRVISAKFRARWPR